MKSNILLTKGAIMVTSPCYWDLAHICNVCHHNATLLFVKRA